MRLILIIRSHRFLLLAAKKALDEVGSNVAVGCIWVDVECHGDNGVDTKTHGALEIIALSVLNEVVDNQDGDEENDGLEALEVQSHGLSHDPAEDDEEGSDE
jgi:hypothetical protein